MTPGYVAQTDACDLHDQGKDLSSGALDTNGYQGYLRAVPQPLPTSDLCWLPSPTSCDLRREVGELAASETRVSTPSQDRIALP